MLCYEFPPLGGGGAKVVYGLSKELVKRGLDIDLVTMGYQGLPKYEQINGVHVYRVPCLRTKKPICFSHEMASYVFLAIPTILKLMKQNKYSVNHTHFIVPDGIASWIVRKISGLPYIITAHGSDVPRYNPNRFKRQHRLLSPLWRRIIHDANRVVCPTKSLESLVLEREPNIRISRIPNGIDISMHLTNGAKQKRILVVSRMFERKGIQYFLNALEGRALEHEVNIVGDGPYLPVLKQMAENHSTKIRFWGWLENNSSELKELYQTSSIFVLPSEVENFPISLLEAMAASMAIITTEGTGCSEVVGETALLVKPKDPRDIRKALNRLIYDPDLCKNLGKTARVRLEKNFGWGSIAKQYSDLYYEACEGPLKSEIA